MEKLYNIDINGLNTLLIPMKKTDVVSVGMFIKVGSVNETSENNGVAHFLEHLMFKSTTKRPNKTLLKSLDNSFIDLIYCDILYGTGRIFSDYIDLDGTKKKRNYQTLL